jgi:hypothetical protein
VRARGAERKRRRWPRRWAQGPDSSARGARPTAAQVRVAETGPVFVNLSTLRRYVEALGGELHVSARFEDGSVEIGLTESKAAAAR